MREGMAYCMSKMKAFLATSAGELDRDVIAELLVDKMLDKSELISIYIIYLQAMKKNEELKDLFTVLVEETMSLACQDLHSVRSLDFSTWSTDFMIAL